MIIRSGEATFAGTKSNPMITTSLPDTMQAMVMEKEGFPLVMKTLPLPVPADGQVLIKVIACGICRTDLHIIDGELKKPKLPLIPGHEIIGRVVSTGKNISYLHPGDIVGVPWLGYTCGTCKYCLQHHENLCDNALFTGYTMDGGYAEYTVVWEQYCFLMPAIYANASGAPLLCAGLIGYRSWQMIDEHAQNIGIYGFGAAAHILAQIARYKHKSVYAFTRSGDIAAQKFALAEGAVWSGNSLETPPEKLDAAIIFAPYGSLVPLALSSLDKGGTVICGGIHMSDIPAFSYDILWEERSIKSVANLTRADGESLLAIAQQVPVKTTINRFALHQANEALEKLRKGNIEGAIVLIIEERMETDFH